MHEMRTIVFIKLWSTTMYNILYFFDSSKLMIKSMITVKNGYIQELALISAKGGADRCVLTFIC